ncbi:hypothetical protein HNP46_006480 [Pseudomonas nitritireducens]|uniref:Uncharacterized protein n=1 Tax=Pseudomonas nitroreducens TaxID=46680 RepID=A0A7W7KRL3_PSENT|nr:hypothetical protein [Pseudomonas nitritireducens]MBB4867566.1 hypothetical protein [Pseudomonas nitritireducens]
MKKLLQAQALLTVIAFCVVVLIRLGSVHPQMGGLYWALAGVAMTFGIRALRRVVTAVRELH